MGNFMGSYHWKTLKDFVTQIFVCVDQAAAVALETAALPNRCRPGDIVALSGADNQWYICNAVTGVFGADFAAIVPWEASLIAVNAIAQFPGDVHIQDVLDNTLSGDTGAVGNPFDIVAAPTFGVGAGVAAPANDNVEAAASIVAGNNVVATAGGIRVGVGAVGVGDIQLAAGSAIAAVDITTTVGWIATGLGTAPGNVEAAQNVIAGTGLITAAGGVLASTGNIFTAPITGGYILADAARVIGTTGLQAGATAGDHVITRIRRSVLNMAGNGALLPSTTADENLVAVVPATGICIGVQPGAAMVGNSIVQARVNAANVIQVRYANVQAAGNINVAADANFQVLWLDSVVI